MPEVLTNEQIGRWWKKSQILTSFAWLDVLNHQSHSQDLLASDFFPFLASRAATQWKTIFGQ